MPNYNPVQSDAVKARWADDTTGPTQGKTIKIEIEMLDWLASLDGAGAIARHVRQALRNYRKKIEQNH